MKMQTKILLYLILLSFVDAVIPAPIIGIILIYVLYQKPDWFSKIVSDIYDA
jgi:hypothetical protein